MDETTCSGPCACQSMADDRGAVSRRLVLAGAAGAALGAMALAGCASPDDTATPSDPTTPGPTEPAETTTPAKTTTPTEEAPAAEVLAGTDDFPVGGGAVVTAASGTYIVTRPGDSEYAAFVALCPHAQCKRFEVLENTIECQCHFSTFDGGTGERLGGPAPRGLEPVEVRVEGGQVLLA